MTFPIDLKHFKAGEFKFPDKMYVPFLRWLDRVRERSGVPIVLTDDGRQDGDPEPSGSAGSRSLHHRGCAVDFRTRDFNAAQKWKIAEAIFSLAQEAPGKVEFEVVWREKGDRHWHLGVDWTAGKVHELIEADD